MSRWVACAVFALWWIGCQRQAEEPPATVAPPTSSVGDEADSARPDETPEQVEKDTAPAGEYIR